MKPKALLEEFVNGSRMISGSGYTAPSDANALQNEIWYQRRIELWGEGFSFYDIMRLKNRLPAWKMGLLHSQLHGSLILRLKLRFCCVAGSKSEIEANKGISEEDNNAKVAPPKP